MLIIVIVAGSALFVFLVWRFKAIVGGIYLMLYPLKPDLKRQAKTLLKYKKTYNRRKKQINKARVNNIMVTFWSHAGTVAALFVTLFAAFFSLFQSYQSWFSFDNKNLEKFLIFILPLLLAYIVLIFATPRILRRIIGHLPSDTYANLSLGNLNPSEIITFLALKNWELCKAFVDEVTIRGVVKTKENRDEDVLLNSDEVKKKKISDWYEIVNRRFDDTNESENDIWNKEFDSKFSSGNEAEGDAKEEWLAIFNDLRNKALKFRADYYIRIENMKALKEETTRKLNILPIELCHHILQFSPSIFQVRVNNYISSIETIQYVLMNEDWGEESKYVFSEVLREMFRIQEDIEFRRMRNLSQLIFFQNIHEYVIGLASATSTSQSLKIFARGLSSVLEKDSSGYPRSENLVFREFEAMLHRSKAHYGFDLLISLENFYESYYKDDTNRNGIPKLLNNIKYRQGSYIKRGEDKFEKISEDDKKKLKGIREDIVMQYKGAMRTISDKFAMLFSDLIDKHKVKVRRIDANIYLMIFGYSRIVKNILMRNSKLLVENKVKVFVMKENDTEMLDTRMLRFELNDRKEGEDGKVKYSFTASDEFFRSLLDKDDLLIMAAGVEAYDTTRNLLFHTNSYQKRVESLLGYLQSFQSGQGAMAMDKPLKPMPEVFIFGGKYKVYKEFPDFRLSEDSAKKETFADHYDKVDLYNFGDYGITPILISD